MPEFPLSSCDRGVLIMHRILRERGFPGFPIQYHAWLTGRADAARLRDGLRQLNERFPIMTARLVDEGGQNVYWQPQPGAECPLHEHVLPGNPEEVARDFASELLLKQPPLDAGDPLSFHLLHLDDGRDVFLMQFEHTLMDANAPRLLIALLNQIAAGSTEALDRYRPLPDGDWSRTYLEKYDAAQRRKGIWYAVRTRLSLTAARPVTLGRLTSAAPRPRFLVRTLNVDETRQFAQRAANASGTRSASMGLLASAFRALTTVSEEPTRGKYLMTGVGTNFRTRGSTVLFGNQSALMPMFARTEQAADRDHLTAHLARQLRDRIRGHYDVAILQLAAQANPSSRLARALAGRVLFNKQSLLYGYFGETSKAGDHLCGTPIALDHLASLSFPPLGVCLMANVSQGRLVVEMTYSSECVTAERAGRFLDELFQDLLA